jgi:hypothetical protein
VGEPPLKRDRSPGRYPCLRTPLMHHALPPSEPPDGERLRCLRLVVGGAQPHGGWHPSAIARLQEFSSCSPAAFPHQWSSRMMTTSSMVGRSKSGCTVCPALSFKDLHHPCWGGGRGRSGPASTCAGDPLLPPAIGGEGRSLSGELAAAACLAPRSKRLLRCFRCHLPPLGRSVAARPPHECRLRRVRAGHVQALPAPSAAQHVVRREGSTRVLGRSRSCSRGENGSEDLPVRFGAAAACWCGVGGQVVAAVGAEVVVAREGFSADEIVSATCGRTSGSSALTACPRPSCGDVGEGLPTAAFALRSLLLLFSHPRWRSLSLLLQWSPASHLEFVVPQALWCGGCSYPREWNRSSVCNGTLSVGVCSLWLSGPEHLGILA